MLGLCTKHCGWIALLAVGLNVALGSLAGGVHIPIGNQACAVDWRGLPFAWKPYDVLCPGQWQLLIAYLVNGLLNVFLFFFILRALHKPFLHRRHGQKPPPAQATPRADHTT